MFVYTLSKSKCLSVRHRGRHVCCYVLEGDDPEIGIGVADLQDATWINQQPTL